MLHIRFKHFQSKRDWTKCCKPCKNYLLKLVPDGIVVCLADYDDILLFGSAKHFTERCAFAIPTPHTESLRFVEVL